MRNSPRTTSAVAMPSAPRSHGTKAAWPRSPSMKTSVSMIQYIFSLAVDPLQFSGDGVGRLGVGVMVPEQLRRLRPRHEITVGDHARKCSALTADSDGFAMRNLVEELSEMPGHV